MKVYILRHGEAEGHSPEGDFGRNLTLHGRTQAEQVLQRFRFMEFVPEAVFYSTANRATQTVQPILDEFADAKNFATKSLYLAGVDAMRKVVSEHRKELSSLKNFLFVGHNPGWSEAISRLSGEFVGLGVSQGALLEIDHEDICDALQLDRSWSYISG